MKRAFALLVSLLLVLPAAAQPSAPAPGSPGSTPAPPESGAAPAPSPPSEGAPDGAPAEGGGASEPGTTTPAPTETEAGADESIELDDVPVTGGETPPADEVEPAAEEDELSLDDVSVGDTEAEEEAAEAAEELDVGDTMVVGRRARDLDRLPGAANVVTEDQLRQQAPFNANEAVRRMPGVTVRDEEGAGLRANIGIRGLNPDRSRNVLILEDGVPVQVMPYGYPELYYTPRIDRMRGVELVKGAGSVLYGPQTLGGVLNFVSLDPPQDLNIRGNIQYGSYDSLTVSASVGDTIGDVGYLVHATNFHFQGPRLQDVAVTDLMGKIRADLGDGGILRVKLQGYFESSGSTYLGLTTPQFAANPSANYAINDRMVINRFATQISHAIELGQHVDLVTTAYGSIISRDWGRQDWLRAPDMSHPTDSAYYQRVIDGQGNDIVNDPTLWRSDGSQVFFLNTRSNRNRDFRIAGIEPRATWRFHGWGERHQLIAGTRVHYEDARDMLLLGDTPTAQSGNTIEDAFHRNIAWATYLQLKLGFFDDKLQVTPGFRTEAIWSAGITYREAGVDIPDPKEGTTFLFAPIPGIGASYAPNEHATIYAGVHRGFAPPRIYDNILPTGQVLNLAAQYSWNYELGTRLAWGDWLFADVSGFVMSFENQIVAPSEATTGGNSDGTLQGGQTRSIGAEISGVLDLAEKLDLGFQLPLQVAYTFVDARTVGNDWPIGQENRILPYAPKNRLNATLGFIHPIGIEAQVNCDYQTYQYADLYDNVDPNPSGTIGLVPSRFLLDARVAYAHRPTGLTFYVMGKNLLNNVYIASRAPAGIFPGMFRQLFVGVSLDY
ncbi:MAG: TonB-dependent receptor [Polyangiales bacterium]